MSQSNEEKQARRRAFRKEKREKGECYHCNEPAAPGRSSCKLHLAENNRHTKTKRKNWLEQGRCSSCGRPRIGEGFGSSAQKCPACLEREYLSNAMNNFVNP
jgi:hypothetical protein